MALPQMSRSRASEIRIGPGDLDGWGAERTVRPWKLSDLPKQLQAEARRLAGMPARGYRAAKPERVSNRIPASWTDHRKSCGWAGSSKECPMCGPVGPCPYCGEEGNSDVEAARRINSPK